MTGMITSLIQTTDNITEQFIFAGYSSLVQSYSTAIYSLSCLAITFYGYAILNGWVLLSIAETTKRLLLISLVISLALHWDFFSEYVYNFFTNAPEQIASHIITAIPGSLVSDQTSVYNALQQAFYEGVGFGNASWEHGSIPSNCLPYLYAVIIYILTYLIAAICVVELIASKLVMAIYLVLAPIIIPLLLFPATKALVFDGWLRHLVTCALIPIYIMSTIALSLMLMAAPTSNVQSAISSDALTLTNIGGYILCLLVVLFLTLIATHMAISTAGGASTSIAYRLENLSSKAWNKLTHCKDKNSISNKEFELAKKHQNQSYSSQNNNHTTLDPNRSIQNEVNNQYQNQNQDQNQGK